MNNEEGKMTVDFQEVLKGQYYTNEDLVLIFETLLKAIEEDDLPGLSHGHFFESSVSLDNKKKKGGFIPSITFSLIKYKG